MKIKAAAASRKPAILVETHPALLGGVLAVVVCLVLRKLPAPYPGDFLAAFLAATASVYVGAALARGQALAVETAAFAVVFALALAGLWHSPVWLALGYALHGAWDFLHHGPRLGASAGARFPWLCLSFDGIVALFVLYHWGLAAH